MIWRVVEHRSSRVKFAVYQDLLEKAAGFMPPGKKIVFLADRGFGDHQLMDFVRKTLRWEFRIRLKPRCLFYAPGLGWRHVHTYRGMSYLKIGWEWVTSYIRKGWDLWIY